MLSTVILVLVVVAFAWNLGVHYTGAVMGMPYSARAIALWPALLLIGIFTIIGATFASGRVEATVGQHIIAQRLVTVPDAIVIVLAAGLLTTLFNYRKVPTSTIQILVSCVVGVGLAARIPIAWDTIEHLVIVWVLAPPVAFVLGFLFTRLLDRLVPPSAARALAKAQIEMDQADAVDKIDSARGPGAAHGPLARAFPGVALAWSPPRKAHAAGSMRPVKVAQDLTLTTVRLLPGLLVLVGIAASFVLGANDVSNATGAFVMTNLFSLTVAGLIGGIAMAVGALTWGQRILHTVAFDIVHMDLTMASAAQGVQALVVLAAVTQGFFTSMNQALIGAMAGTGLARGSETVQRKQILGILRGWLIGPISGLALAFALDWLVRLVAR